MKRPWLSSALAALLALGPGRAPAQTWHRQFVTRGPVKDVDARPTGIAAVVTVQNQGTTPCLQVTDVDPRGRIVRCVRTAEPSALQEGLAASTSDGGLLLVGLFARILPGSSISRLRPDLSAQWQVAMRDASIRCVVELPDGGFLLGGEEYRDRLAPPHAVIIRLDAWGRRVWDRAWARPVDSAVTSLALLPDGGAVAVVQHRLIDDEAFGVFGIDADGAPRWQWWHPGQPTRLQPEALIARADGSVLMAFAAGSGGTFLWHVTISPDGSVTDVSRYSSRSSFPSGSPLARPGDELWTIDRVPIDTLGYRIVRLDGSGTPLGGRYFDFGVFQTTMGIPAFVGLPSGAMLATYEDVGGGTARLLRLDGSADMPACSGSDETLTRWSEPNPFVPDDTPSTVPDLATQGWAIRLRAGVSWTSSVVCEDPAGPPGEVSPPTSPAPLKFAGKTTLTWEDAALSGSETFFLLRGSLPALRAGDYGACLQASLTASTATDAESPGLGPGWFYLVHGRNAFGDGTLGVSSARALRLPSMPCP